MDNEYRYVSVWGCRIIFHAETWWKSPKTAGTAKRLRKIFCVTQHIPHAPLSPTKRNLREISLIINEIREIKRGLDI